MLSQALIKTLLESSLPLRLALLDADPNGVGDHFRPGATLGTHYESLAHVKLPFAGRVAKPFEWVAAGHAWLPCNPLAIVEHAAERKWPMSGALVTYAIDGQRVGRYCASITLPTLGALVRSFGDDPHTAAVALLREVVGG